METLKLTAKLSGFFRLALGLRSSEQIWTCCTAQSDFMHTSLILAGVEITDVCHHTWLLKILGMHVVEVRHCKNIRAFTSSSDKVGKETKKKEICLLNTEFLLLLFSYFSFH